MKLESGKGGTVEVLMSLDLSSSRMRAPLPFLGLYDEVFVIHIYYVGVGNASKSYIASLIHTCRQHAHTIICSKNFISN